MSKRDSNFNILSSSLTKSTTFDSVIAATIIQLAMIQQQKPTDPMYRRCEFTISQQIVHCLSIVTACWGQLRPFIHSLESHGLLISPNAESGHRSYPRSATQSKGDVSGRESLNYLEPQSEDGAVIQRCWEAGS